MSRKYKFWDNQRMYFISFATVNWIDFFTRNEYKDEMIKSWQFCQEKKGLKIYAWCIMPSHVHMLIGSNDKPMEDIVRDMKSFTSTQMRKLIKEDPQESRREWLLWMFERAGKKNGNNNDWSRMLSGAATQSTIRNKNRKNVQRNCMVYTSEPCCEWLCVRSRAMGLQQCQRLRKK